MLRAVLIAAGLLLGGAAPLAAQGRYQPQGAAQTRYAEGQERLAAGDALRAAGDAAGATKRYEAAETAFRAAIEADPAFVDAYVKLGLVDYTLGRSKAALPLLEAALKQAPEDLDLQFWLGNNRLRAGETVEGVKLLERVAAGDRFPEAWLVLGTHFYKTHDYTRARPQLERYTKVRPEDVAARGTLGNTYSQLGLHAEALAELEAAQRVSPGNLALQINIGNAHYQLGHYEKAVALLQDALEKDPARQSVFFNLAQSHFQLKQYAEAVRFYRRYVEYKPKNFNGHYFLGSALLEMGDDAAALASLTEAARLKPKQSIAHYKIGLLHLRAKRTDAAETALETARALTPEDAWVASALGTVARQRGQWPKAIELQQRAAAQDPAQARLHANLALSQYGAGQLEVAQAGVTRALGLAGDDAWIRSAAVTIGAAAAQAKLASGDAAGGLALVDRALALAPADPRLLADQSLARLAAGQAEAALQSAEAAAKTGGEQPEVLYALGRALLATGRPADAVKALSLTHTRAPRAATAAALGAALLLAGDVDAACTLLETALGQFPEDEPLRADAALAHFARLAAAFKAGNAGRPGDLRIALAAEEALDPASAARVRYLALVLALRRGDGAAALNSLPRSGSARAEGVLHRAPPGHLDFLTAFAQTLARHEDRALPLLEGLRGARIKGSPEARLLRRVYERQAERQLGAGEAAAAAQSLKAAAALGRDPVVDHNLLAVEYAQTKKANLEPRFRALLGAVPEAAFNLGIVLDALGRHEDAYKMFVRYAATGGPYAAKAREVVEAKKRLYGFD